MHVEDVASIEGEVVLDLGAIFLDCIFVGLYENATAISF